MKKCLLLVSLLAATLLSSAVGQWTEYRSYRSALSVVAVDGKFYCVTAGGLFSYDPSDNSIRKLTTIEGLSDVGVKTIGYSADADVLVVAYENSNLDLVFPDGIFNMSDIKRKPLLGDKSIYNILTVGKTAYLSCGFGVVVIDLDRKEVKATCYIGDNGGAIRVNDLCTDGTFLYAATEAGVYKADINSDNLQYYGNWILQTGLDNPTGEYTQAEYVGGKVVVNYHGGSNADALYSSGGNGWTRWLQAVTAVNGLTTQSDQLLVAGDGHFSVYAADGQFQARISSYTFGSKKVDWITPQNGVTDGAGNFWLADKLYGLVKVSSAGSEQMIPDGPASNRVFALLANGTDLWVADGGRTPAWNNLFYDPRIGLFRDNSWSSFDAASYSALSSVHDLVCVAVDPADANHVFAGSWGGGVFEFKAGSFVARYNNQNSSLQTAIPAQPDEPYVRISGMQFDSNRNLWVVNSIVDKPLSVMSPSGNWQAYALPGINSSTDVGPFVVTGNDDLWITIPRNQNTLIVRKADGTASLKLAAVARYVSGSAEILTPMTDIYSIATDRDGAVWFGTAVGVGVYAKPAEVWNGGSFYATRPGLDEGDGLYHPLLSTQTVTAIAVDGANRKWFGTKSSGVYLISADGTDEILHFTTANSPLLSDEITSLAINPKTGEVFIGTSLGLVSYRGAATEGNDSYDGVYAYPNPVRETYTGDVVITGLIEDTDIKITDISGNLVFKTTSLGGQAVWDGKNLRGNRVSTGVYLVFGNDRDGKESFVTKILFIH